MIIIIIMVISEMLELEQYSAAYSKIVYFYQHKINCPNSFHIDSDGGNIEKFHHPAGDEITL